jgi:hypothetical protein
MASSTATAPELTTKRVHAGLVKSWTASVATRMH